MSEEADTVEFDVPSGATYGGHEVTEIGYNLELDRIYVIYEGTDLPGGWDQLIFTSCQYNGGNPVLNPDGVPAGVMPPAEARTSDSPGGNEAESLYDLLESVGIDAY